MIIFYRVKKAQKQLDVEAAEKTEDDQALNPRQLEEGDLFGVRAIESGYFGGVSQSRPASTANSPQVGPTSKGLESPSVISINSASSSKADILSNVAMSKSTTSLALNKEQRPAMPVKKLRPSEAELNGRLNHAAVDVDMKAEMPPSPIAFKTPDLPMPPSIHPGNTWSMHSGSPSSSPDASQEDLSAGHAPPKMPAVSLKHLSNSDSIEVEVGSPTIGVFPPAKPKKAAQRQSRGAFTGNAEENAFETRSRQRNTLAVSNEDRYKKAMTVELSHLSGISQWGEKVMADLASQKTLPSTPKSHHLSKFFEPEQFEQLNFDKTLSEIPKQVETSNRILEPIESEPEPTHTKNVPSGSASVYSMIPVEKKRTTSITPEHARSSSEESGKSIKRTQDSLKQARKQFSEELPLENRRSLDRDQIHYDPRPAARTRAGSVVGRSVDFDHPRSSPFVTQPTVALAIATTNPNLTKAPYVMPSSTLPASHAYQSSISSYEDSDRGISPTHSAKSSASSFSIPVSRFSTAAKEPTVSTIATSVPTINYSSASIGSSTNTTDVYESLYRKSVMAQRASMVAEMDFDEKPNNCGLTAGSKKPANLTLGTSGYSGVETIVEVETPMASPIPSLKRYPKMA